MPSLSRAVFFAIISAVAFILASDIGPRLPLWVRFILVAMGVITAAGAIVEGVNWLSYVAAQRVGEIRRIQTMTPVMEILRVMTNLSPQAQTELAFHFNLLGVDYHALIGHPEPVFFFDYGGQRIPFEFIAAFFALSTDRHLPAVRQWRDGSHQHMYADALTAYLVKHHYAMPAIGNQPASWIWEHGTESLRYRAEQAFGLVESDEYEE